MKRRRKRQAPRKRNVGEQFAAALDRLTAAEAKLARAFSAWARARQDVKACERRLDAMQAESERGVP